jgi:hypothetical protein
MKLFVALLLVCCSTLLAQKAGAESGVDSILQVKRIYVAPLEGGAQAQALRDLIIASLNTTKLFILTENPERADAILKGSADDNTFTDSFDSNENVAGRANVSKTSGATSLYTRAAGLALGSGGAESDAHHIKERKHEAFATVRLCNKEGDVLWSSTQESLGAKFRGASADVAARIGRQISLDYERERRKSQLDIHQLPSNSIVAPDSKALPM